MILWKPYIFNCLTKLENCSKARKTSVTKLDEKRVYMLRLALTLLCLKCDPRIVLLNSATLETTKLVPSSVQLINWADFGSIIILERNGRILEKLSGRERTNW